MKDSVICINDHLIYVPLLNGIVQLEHGWKYPSMVSLEIDDEFIKKHAKSFIWEEHYKQMQRVSFKLSKPLLGFLVLTNKCNFDCSFCYAHANTDKSSPTFKVENLRKLMRMLDREQMTEVSFTGGEPLLEWETLQECVSLLNCKFKIFTNGSLLTDDKVEYILANKGKLYLSMDVPSDSVQMHKDITKHVKQLVQKFPQLRERIEVSACVSCRDFDKIGLHRKDITKILGPSDIDYNYICTGMDLVGLTKVIEDDKALLMQGDNPSSTIFGRYARWVGEWLSQGAVLTSCTSTISLNYRGDLLLCHEYGSFFDKNPLYSDMTIANVSDLKSRQDLLDKVFSLEVARKTGFRKEECSRCSLRWICGGVCWANIKVNLHLCFLANQIIPHFLYVLAEKSNALHRRTRTDFAAELWIQGVHDEAIKLSYKQKGDLISSQTCSSNMFCSKSDFAFRS